MKNMVNIQHHQDDYECMWNGIEDLYITKTGETIPNGFFFALSGFANLVYLKFKTGELKRMPFFGDGRTRQMYDFLKDIVGFTYHYTEGRSFSYTLRKAKEEIDRGFPVVLGALDMYELEYYPKMYHRLHIPIHYVLMVGYDDDRESLSVLDCGKNDIQVLPYDCLERALAIEPTPLSKNNTICSIRMEQPKDKRTIAWKALRKKADRFLNPPISSLGYKGFKKFAAEFSSWQDELNEEDYRKCLTHIAMFVGTVPIMPNKLIGADTPDEVLHMAARERLSEVLLELGNEFNNTAMTRSGEKFLESGRLITEFADLVINTLAGESEKCNQAGTILDQAAEVEKVAYELMLKSVE
jgi:hypothetical protein